MIELALIIAATAHEGQVDKAGLPYIYHPLEVASRVTDPVEKVVAILHDTVEDCEWITLTGLAANFPREVVDAVDALTKRKGETRMDAAYRAAQNPIALEVKMADVSHNMEMGRIPNPTEKDYARLKEYEEVMVYLKTVRAIK